MLYRNMKSVGVAAAVLALAGAASARPDGNAGIGRGAADADGGTVTVTVKEEGNNGRTYTKTIQVAPGESSESVMARMEEAIRTDFASPFTTTVSPFTIGDPPNRRPVDNITIRGTAGWKIGSIYIDPDSTGFKDYGSGGNVSKSMSFDLRDDLSRPLPVMCRLNITRVDGEAITGTADVLFSSGIGAWGALDLVAGAAGSMGLAAVRVGDRVELGVIGASERLLMSITTVNPGNNTPFFQGVNATFVPTPCTAGLGLLGVLAVGRRRR